LHDPRRQLGLDFTGLYLFQAIKYFPGDKLLSIVGALIYEARDLARVLQMTNALDCTQTAGVAQVTTPTLP
jgi:hypothetical protein